MRIKTNDVVRLMTQQDREEMLFELAKYFDASHRSNLEGIAKESKQKRITSLPEPNEEEMKDVAAGRMLNFVKEYRHRAMKLCQHEISLIDAKDVYERKRAIRMMIEKVSTPIVACN